MNLLALIFLFLVTPQDQVSPIQALQNQIEATNDESQQARLYLDLALMQYYSDPESAMLSIETSIDLAKRNNLDETLIKALTKYSKFHVFAGDHVKAKSIALEAMQMADESNSAPLQILALDSLGTGATMLGDYKLALEYYNRGLDLITTNSITDPQLLLLIYGNVIRSLEELGQYTKAIEYALKAYEVVKDNPASSINSLFNISLLYIRMKDYENAEIYASKLLEDARKVDHFSGVSGAYACLGDIKYFSWEKTQNKASLDEAELLYRKAVDTMSRVGEDIYFVDRLIAFANTLNKQTKFAEAEKALLKALSISEELHSKKNSSQAHFHLVETYRGLNNQSKAWLHNKQYLNLVDQINQANMDQQVSAMMIRFDVSEKEHALNIEKARNQILEQETQIKNQQLLLISIAAIFVILLLVASYYAYRQKRKAAKVYEDLSKYDPLTKLMNRRAISEMLEIEVARFQRNNSPFTLILTDIDHFKKFNDTYGHECGDEVLKTVAREFTNGIRKQDVISRWGGEEFLIMLPETTSEEGALVSEKLRKRIADSSLDWDGKQLMITMSFGVCQFGPDTTVEHCISCADEALYSAKEAGRNRVAIHK